MEKGKVIIDFGNSETRVVVLYGENGKPQRRSYTLSNRFATVTKSYRPSDEDYNPQTSFVFASDAVVNGEEVKGYYANGEVVEREFTNQAIRPSAMQKKCDLTTTALSFQVVMYHAMTALSKITGKRVDALPDIEWTVVALMPPQHTEDKENIKKMTAIIKSVEHVCMLYPQVSFDVNTRNVYVLPEGMCAFIACVMDVGQVFRKEYKHIVKKDAPERVLILDIGGGTTDYLVMEGMRKVSSTLGTAPLGGNNVFSRVNMELSNSKGWRLNPKDVENGIYTGRIKVGVREHDITTIVSRACDVTASEIVNRIREYLEATGFPLNSVGYLLVCGGGALPSKNENVTPLGEAVKKYIMQLHPDVGILDIPTRTSRTLADDGSEVSTTAPLSPRELNILGASIFAEKLN